MRIYEFSRFNTTKWNRSSRQGNFNEPETFLKKAAGGEDMLIISPEAAERFERDLHLVRLHEEREQRLRDHFTEKVIMRATRAFDEAFPGDETGSLFDTAIVPEEADIILRKTVEILLKQLS